MNKASDKFRNNIQTLKSVLEQQHVQLLSMLSILRQEHQALNSNNLELFEQTLLRKQQQVRMLEQIQPQLSSIEKMLGGVLSKSTFSAFIQRMPEGTDRRGLESLWETFHETLEECKLQNKTNNHILNASAINLKQALNILRGNTEHSTAAVYSHTGQQQETLEGHSLAIA